MSATIGRPRSLAIACANSVPMEGQDASTADIELQTTLSLTIAGDSPEVAAIDKVVTEAVSSDSGMGIVDVERDMKYIPGGPWMTCGPP